MRHFLLCVLFCGCLSMQAALADDFIDWGQLGPDGAVLSTPQPWISQSTAFIGLVGNVSGGTFQRLDQGNGWNGNFSTGDHLIWNQGGPTDTGIDLGIEFDNQFVFGGNAQIQADFFGAFTATLTAFDHDGNVLGQVTEQGQSNSNGDGSAISIGFRSSLPNVYFLEFNVVDVNGGDSLAINGFNIYTSGTTTPEPGSLLLLGSGLLGTLAYGRTRLFR